MVKKAIEAIKISAQEVIAELGAGWQEAIYQQAMEVALRNKKITYETQRNLPITFSGHVVGESKPDLIIWVASEGKRVAIVVDLKADTAIKGEQQVQVERYIKELKKQVSKNESVWSIGLVINFIKEKTATKIEEGVEEKDGVQVLEVRV